MTFARIIITNIYSVTIFFSMQKYIITFNTIMFLFD